jgi:hypothetical protein
VNVLPDELTGTEQAVLLVLMAQARPVPNARLKDYGPELKKDYRDRLRDKKLIDVTGSPMVLELTDDGWVLCRKIFGSDAPDGVTGQKKAIYTLMKALDRYLDRVDTRLADVFAPASPEAAPESDPVPAPEPAPAPDPPASVDSRVRAAYGELTARPGGWVGLAALRTHLAAVSRIDLDAALLRLFGDPAVSFTPEENQKTLTDADRAAAVRIGNKDLHLIAMHS